MTSETVCSSLELRVNYATASAAAVAAFAAAHHNLGDEPPSCTLLSRGFDDTYVLRTSVGDLFARPFRRPAVDVRHI